MNDSLQTTQVNMDGLLEVFGKNLYSTPSVALRELIQNAHDACQRFKIETKEHKEFRIKLSSDYENQTLVIDDNGSGLTRGEISDYLATIGSGYTRVLRHSSNSEDMIGYFGLGFLSAYVVAKKVEVYTRSYQSPDKCWRFTSVGGKTFTISDISEDRRQIGGSYTDSGTRVVLHLEDEYHSLAEQSLLVALIKRYCCLLPISIFVNDIASPINATTPPWNQEENASLQKQKRVRIEFAKLFDEDFEPLCCIAVPSDNPFGLKGILWLQGGGSYNTSDNRAAHIFARNMFITDEDKELLPNWAGFVSAVFECSSFLPTASRESIQRNEQYYQIVNYIKAFWIDMNKHS